MRVRLTLLSLLLLAGCATVQPTADDFQGSEAFEEALGYWMGHAGRILAKAGRRPSRAGFDLVEQTHQQGMADGVATVLGGRDRIPRAEMSGVAIPWTWRDRLIAVGVVLASALAFWALVAIYAWVASG